MGTFGDFFYNDLCKYGSCAQVNMVINDLILISLLISNQYQSGRAFSKTVRFFAQSICKAQRAREASTSTEVKPCHLLSAADRAGLINYVTPPDL